MKTLEQLNTEKTELLSQLRGSFKDSEAKNILAKLKTIESEVKKLNQIKLIDSVNTKYKRLRELAKMAFECERPETDIICNDGTFHAVKVKKYPKIKALEYARAKFEGNKMISITVNGEKFELYRVKYESGKPNEYILIETFEEFLKYNSLPLKDFTFEEYVEFSNKLEALNQDIKAKIEEYKNQVKELNTYSMQHFGLATQSNEHFYTYSPKNY
jgi:hypothetical protein